jgi:hypothetical protein
VTSTFPRFPFPHLAARTALYRDAAAGSDSCDTETDARVIFAGRPPRPGHTHPRTRPDAAKLTLTSYSSNARRSVPGAARPHLGGLRDHPARRPPAPHTGSPGVVGSASTPPHRADGRIALLAGARRRPAARIVCVGVTTTLFYAGKRHNDHGRMGFGSAVWCVRHHSAPAHPRIRRRSVCRPRSPAPAATTPASRRPGHRSRPLPASRRFPAPFRPAPLAGRRTQSGVPHTGPADSRPGLSWLVLLVSAVPCSNRELTWRFSPTRGPNGWNM